MGFNLVWRLVALVALLAYCTMVFLLLRFVIRNVGFAILFSLTTAFVAYAAWLLASGSGRRLRRGGWYLGGAIFLLVAEASYLFSHILSLQEVLGFAGLVALYLVFFELLRKKYWGNRRQAGQQTRRTAHFSHPYLIINPKAGNGRAIKARIESLAREQGIKVLVMKKSDDVEALARQAAGAGADVLGISGGDGSIGAVAKVALETGLPMVVLPGGTRCHFARDLGLEPERIADALAGFNGVERRIDVGDINGRIFLNNVSFGLYADIVDNPEYRDHKMQVSRDVLRSLVSGQKELYDLQFQRKKLHVTKAAQVLVGVNSYNTVNLFELGHRNRLDGGLLQVTAITELNDALVKRLIMGLGIGRLTGKDAIPGVYQWEADSFEITNESGAIVVGVDGEREDYSTPARIRVLPRVLRVFVPAEGVRNRAKSPISFSAVRNLWRAVAR